MRFLARTTGSALLLVSMAAAHAQGPSALPDYHGVKVAQAVARSSVSISSTTPIAALTTVEMYPVVYCGDAGGGPDEYAVPSGSGPDAAVNWLLQVPNVPAGARIYDARYEPLDNIIAIAAFSHMEVWPVDDSHIDLTALAYPGCSSARLRLKITVSYAR